ncbi:nucleoporin, Nup155-like, partial [Kipferlia bialata]
ESELESLSEQLRRLSDALSEHVSYVPNASYIQTGQALSAQGTFQQTNARQLLTDIIALSSYLSQYLRLLGMGCRKCFTSLYGLPCNRSLSRSLSLPMRELLVTSNGTDAAELLILQITKRPRLGDAISQELSENCGMIYDRASQVRHKAMAMLNRASNVQLGGAERYALSEAAFDYFRQQPGSIHPLDSTVSALCNAGSASLAVKACLLYMNHISRSMSLPLSSSLSLGAADSAGEREGERVAQCVEHVMKVIVQHALVPGVDQTAAVRIIQAAADVAQPRPYHEHLYEFLLRNPPIGPKMLLHIHSPFIEPYLRQRESDRTREREVPSEWDREQEGETEGRVRARDVLHVWLQRRGRNFEASEVILGLALDETLEMTLDERRDYLALAATRLATCRPSADNVTSLSENKAQVTMLLTISQAQIRMRDTLRARAQVETGDSARMTDAAARLDSQLYQLNTLYNEYAAPLGMYRESLEVLYLGDHTSNKRLLRIIWGKLVRESLSHYPMTEGERGGERDREAMLSVMRDVVSLLELLPVSAVSDLEERLPLAYVMALLEGVAMKRGLPAGWVASRILGGQGETNVSAYGSYASGDLSASALSSSAVGVVPIQRAGPISVQGDSKLVLSVLLPGLCMAYQRMIADPDHYQLLKVQDLAVSLGESLDGESSLLRCFAGLKVVVGHWASIVQQPGRERERLIYFQYNVESTVEWALVELANKGGERGIEAERREWRELLNRLP